MSITVCQIRQEPPLFNATARWTDAKGVIHVRNAEGNTPDEARRKVKP